MAKKTIRVKLHKGQSPKCPRCGDYTKFKYFGGSCEIFCPSCGKVGELKSPYSEVATLYPK